MIAQDWARLYGAVADKEPIVYQIEGDDDRPGMVRSEIMLPTSGSGHIVGTLLYQKLVSGRERQYEVHASRPEMLVTPGSVRRLCDIPAPEFDDRPNELIPEDYYACR